MIENVKTVLTIYKTLLLTIILLFVTDLCIDLYIYTLYLIQFQSFETLVITVFRNLGIVSHTILCIYSLKLNYRKRFIVFGCVLVGCYCSVYLCKPHILDMSVFIYVIEEWTRI